MPLWNKRSRFFWPEIGSSAAVVKHTRPVISINLPNIFHKPGNFHKLNRTKKYWKLRSVKSELCGRYVCSIFRLISGTSWFYIVWPVGSCLMELTEEWTFWPHSFSSYPSRKILFSCQAVLIKYEHAYVYLCIVFVIKL